MKFFIVMVLISSSLTAYAQSIQGIVLAAGRSTRFATDYSKQSTPMCGLPLVLYPVNLLAETFHMPTTVVLGYKKEEIRTLIEQAQLEQITFSYQEKQLGTGHALHSCESLWNADHLLVLNGDMPLINADIVQNLITKHLESDAAISIVISYNTDTACTYGRIVQDNESIKVVEIKHFTGSREEHPFVNAGIYIMKKEFAQNYLPQVPLNPVTKEYYITDLIELASNSQLKVCTSIAPYEALNGVNSLKELSIAHSIKRNQIIEQWMKQGVRFEMPETVGIDLNVSIGKNSVIGAGAQLINRACIGKNCTIGAHTVIDGAVIEDNSIIKPLSYITLD